MPLIRTGPRPRARKLLLAAAALIVTAPVAAVAGVSAAEDRPAGLATARTAAAATVNNTAVTPLRRRPGWTDIVYVGAQGHIKTASRGPDGQWFTQFLNRGDAAPNTKVTGVKRYNGRLDVFTVGTDRQVYTAYLDEEIDGQGSMRWYGWTALPGVKVNKGTSVNVVSVNRDTMDLFTLDDNQWQMTLRWTAAGGWGTWQSLNHPDENTRSVGTAEITAAAVGRDIHVFTQERDLALRDSVMTKRYVNGQGWGRWQELPNKVIIPAYGSEIVPVVRASALHIFVVQAEIIQHEGQSIWTSMWDGQAWSTPTRVTEAQPRRGTSVHAVLRGRSTIDAFAIDSDKHVWTAAWTPAADWNGWWALDGEVADETSVTAVSDGIGDLQIFVHGKDPEAVFPIWTRRWSSSGGWGAWENVTP